MKKSSKALLTVLSAGCLIVGSVFGTLAYLTSSDSVENTFTVGKVNITMDEALVTEYGDQAEKDGDSLVANSTSTERTEVGNAYKLIPSHTYTKDPIVYVQAGSEPSFLFVKVENGISEIEAEGATGIHEQMISSGWNLIDGETNVYYYEDIVDARSEQVNVDTFKTFTIATNANVDSFADDGDKKDAVVKVTAYAVQADGFATDLNASVVDTEAGNAWGATFASN